MAAPTNPTLQPPTLSFLFRMRMRTLPPTAVLPSAKAGGASRIVLPFAPGGTVEGPALTGVVHHAAGADWATKRAGGEVFELDARYTLEDTRSKAHIYVQSRGLMKRHIAPPPPPPGTPPKPATDVSQSEADWFSHLSLTASDEGPLAWANGVFAVGTFAMVAGELVIDVYALTNKPGGVLAGGDFPGTESAERAVETREERL